jgi:hypothetical protein
MRKTLSIGITATLAAVVVTAWAMAVTQPQKREATTAGIDVFRLMTGSRDLQAQQYEAF